MQLIEKVRRDHGGNITHVQWFEYATGCDPASTQVEVIVVVNAVHAGIDVRSFIDGYIGYKVVPAGPTGGFETIDDKPDRRRGRRRLADLPTF